MELNFVIDPITRYLHISYSIPDSVPDIIQIRFEACEDGAPDWKPMSVLPYMSETALSLIPGEEWKDGMLRGVITEMRSAGLVRTVVFNPFLHFGGKLKGRIRVTVLNDGIELGKGETGIDIENNDVIVINDWSKVIQNNTVSEIPEEGAQKWLLKKKFDGDYLFGNISLEVAEKGVELPALTYPLELKGNYAVFVSLPPKLGTIELRFSGEERTQIFETSRVGEETLWQWRSLNFQHLVIKQPYRSVFEYEDNYRAHLDTVRLVPLSEEYIRQLDEIWKPSGEKRIVAGYNEPYSWAFYEKVYNNLQHWEPLLAFSEARLDFLDIQIGRGGSSMVCESRAGSQLLHATHGDPVRGKVPQTGNVGRMQQYTNTLETQLKYARMLGMKPFANLGATNCYVGTGLESDFSKKHPEWREGGSLKYDVPEVRAYILSLIEEALQIGAEGIGIDWCRYPNSLKDKETATIFFRELKELTSRYEAQNGKSIEIMTRFPARGVSHWQYMDYRTWVAEGLIDYLCPGNLQGRHMNFDITEYADAVRGTRTRLLPACDGLHWGLPLPGMMYERIIKCYEKGADGVYIYQCDAPVLNSPETRRYISLIGSIGALNKWQSKEQLKQALYSKGIYVTPPHADGKYASWGRLRVWCEGFAPSKLEMYVDNILVNKYDCPPYILTSEEHEDDNAIPSGNHILRTRAFDGEGWLEKEFNIVIK